MELDLSQDPCDPMGTLIYIWDAPGAELATYAIQHSRLASRPLRSYTAIQRYTALYSAIHYTAIHRYTLCNLPGAATPLAKVTGVIVTARLRLTAAAGCEAPPP
eukprot:scaffold86249_cov66-Phaeocystis_antarctica.AAC.3